MLFRQGLNRKIAYGIDDALHKYAIGEITKKGLVAFFLDIYPEFSPGANEQDDLEVCAKLGLTKFAFTMLVGTIRREREVTVEIRTPILNVS